MNIHIYILYIYVTLCYYYNLEDVHEHMHILVFKEISSYEIFLSGTKKEEDDTLS